MPTSINYQALHAELCQFLPKNIEVSEDYKRGLDYSTKRHPNRADCAVTGAGETVLRIHYWVRGSDGNNINAFFDVPLAFAFSEIGLAELLSGLDTIEAARDRTNIIARAIAYLENEHLGGESSEGT
jgi:hypothetical protein